MHKPPAGEAARASQAAGRNRENARGENASRASQSQSAATSPIAEKWDKERFRREVRPDKIPIRHPKSLVSLFAKQLGETLAPYAFFERAGRCVLLEFDYKTQVFQLVEAEPYGFRTDIEAVVAPYVEKLDEKTGELTRHHKTISLECSRTVLCAKEFLQELRPIYGFSSIRLPFRRPDGKIELLPEGYDPDSGILTASANGSSNYISKAGELLIDDAAYYLRGLLSEFCLRDKDKERSISVMIAAMLTMFLRLLLGPRIAKPAFLYTANSEGAGKTLAAKLAIIPMLGLCPTTTLPKEEEFRKVLLALALADEPVLFLDNIEGYLRSSALASFLTSPVVQDRILGFSRLLKLEHNTVTFITGNNATYSADLRRRMLCVDLFLEELRAEDRSITHPLDDAKIIAKRSDILAALWRLIHNWIEAKQPEAKLVHPSFLEWSKLIGGILELAGFTSPCTPPAAATQLGGDLDTRDLETLVDKMKPGHKFKYAQLIEFCRDYELFANLIPQEGELDRSQAISFGKILKRVDGRTLKGRYRFHIQGEKRAKVYYVEDLKPAENHQ